MAPTELSNGNESNRYAVVFSNGMRQVISNDACLPEYILLEPELFKDFNNAHSKLCYIGAICRCIDVILNTKAETEQLEPAFAALSSLLNLATRFLRGDQTTYLDVLNNVYISGKCEAEIPTSNTATLIKALCKEADISEDYARVILLPGYCRIVADILSKNYQETLFSKEETDILHKRFSLLRDILCRGENNNVLSKQLTFTIQLFEIEPLIYIGDERFTNLIESVLPTQQYFNSRQLEDIYGRVFNKIRLELLIKGCRNNDKKLAKLSQKYDLSNPDILVDDPFFIKEAERRKFVSGLQKYTLETLVLTKQFLDKHGLRFYLGEGTLLGAIRHHGFIPWDDDVDILMPREDYQKLVKLAKKGEIPPELNFDALENNPKHWVLGAKMQLTRPTEYIQHKVTPLSKYNGPYVDIFVLDYWDTPAGIKNHFCDFCVKYARSVLFLKTGYTKRKLKNKPVRSFFIRLYRPFIKNQWVEKFALKFMKASNKGTRKYAVNLGSYYPYYKEVFPTHFYGDAKFVDFEGERMPVPCEYDAILKSIYGKSYDSIPPVKVAAGHRHPFTLKTPEEMKNN